MDVLVIGGGGCGLVSAIAAGRLGRTVALIEKSAKLGGHTMSTSAIVPAAGTRFQSEKGVDDSSEIMLQDILRQNGGICDINQAKTLCDTSKELVEWLCDECNVPISLILDFNYTGHSRFRMHTTPNRTGSDLIGILAKEIQKLPNVFVLCERSATDLMVEHGVVKGAEVRAGNLTEKIYAKNTILATSGFGANPELKKKYIPLVTQMAYWGSSTHTGEAIIWGEKLGADLTYMDSYQAHSAVSSVGTLVNWVTMLTGGIMVNVNGRRFGNETMSYSSFAELLVQQPSQQGFEIYDEEIHQHMLKEFEEYRQTVSLGGVVRCGNAAGVSTKFSINETALGDTLSQYSKAAGSNTDEFGRTNFKKLSSPLYVVKVTPALFHTQGGLRVNKHTQVLKNDGSVISNLYAGGGAAAGISGSGATGYLTGNGLLSALCYGFIAGRECGTN